MSKKYRILSLVIQPIIVLDDGKELIKCETSPREVTLKELEDLPDKIKAELELMNNQLSEEGTEEEDDNNET